MSDSYEFLFNRALDVTAAVTVPVKLFTMYIVATKTPKAQRYDSHFLLNIFFWNFSGNVIFTFAHLYPMFPAECYRLDGLVALLFDNESLGHAVFIAIMICVLNCALALSLPFPYRYFVFAFPKEAALIRRRWVYLLCAGLHLLLSAVLVAIWSQWIVSYENYPGKADLPSKRLLFCLNPIGMVRFLFFVFFYAVLTTTLGAIVILALLLYRGIRNSKSIVHKHTLNLQRQLLWNLVILTTAILVFGGTPTMIDIVLGCFPRLPYAKEFDLLIIVAMCNHGTISAIVTLTIYKCYRTAVRRTFERAMRKMGVETKIFVARSSKTAVFEARSFQRV